MTVPAALAARVRRRAQNRCEYGRMSQSLQGASFHIEHIIPRKHGGRAVFENLALACPGCNLHKADRTCADDPQTGETAPLFHPRKSQWADHFAWQGMRIRGRTATIKATLSALQFNQARRLLIRDAERGFGLFPPPSSR
ncbi:MAG: HNH endonuclease signature motif containing protein [Chthoniobacteraceae bacterium]